MYQLSPGCLRSSSVAPEEDRFYFTVIVPSLVLFELRGTVLDHPKRTLARTLLKDLNIVLILGFAFAGAGKTLELWHGELAPVTNPGSEERESVGVARYVTRDRFNHRPIDHRFNHRPIDQRFNYAALRTYGTKEIEVLGTAI